MAEMTEVVIWWVVQFALSFMDFVMMYFISHKMMKRYMKVEWHHVVLAILYTALVAPIGYFDGYLFRVVSIIVMLISIKIIIRRAEISDLIMIYIISLLTVGVIQIPLAGGIWLVNQVIEIFSPFSFLLTQMISTIVIVILCKKFHWYKWFNSIQDNPKLKIFISLIGLLVLIPMAIMNFKYSLSYFLLLTLGAVLAGAAIIPACITLYERTVDRMSPKKLRYRMTKLWFEINEKENNEEFKDDFEAFASELGVDLPPLQDKKDAINVLTEIKKSLGE